MDQRVYPAEPILAEQLAAPRDDPWETTGVIEELKVEARRRGLWNLFLPHSPLGAGLSNLQYAPLAEISGHSPQLAPEAMNCSAFGMTEPDVAPSDATNIDPRIGAPATTTSSTVASGGPRGQ